MRSSSLRVIAAVACLLFALSAWRLGPRAFSNFAVEAQTTQNPAKSTANPAATPSAQLKPVSATVSATAASATSATLASKPSALSTETYTTKRGDTITSVAHRYLGQTSYLTSSELADAIRHANGDRASNILKANETLVIPGILPAPIVEKTIPVSKDFEVRAIYLTGVMAASDHGLRIVRHWREVGGNAVVFDIKDSDGSVNIPFEHPLLGEHKVYIHDVAKLVHFLHQQNMHAIARIAMFRDEHLVVNHPELAVQSHKNHTAWRENGKLVWTDPSNPKVQDYDIALAKHVAQLGVDEIQFDYVRFPAEGDQKDAEFVFQSQQASAPADLAPEGNDQACPVTDAPPQRQKNAVPSLPRASTTSRGKDPAADQPAPKGRKSPKTGCAVAASHGLQRSDVIAAFLKKAYAELHPTGVLLSLDVFGVMAWQRPIDLSHTGQDIVRMAKYCDVLSPMIYPSHFFGMDNIAHPGDAPEHFIGESMDRFELITKDSGVVIRPWLQAFHWRTASYSPEYIKVQVATAKDKGGIGFLFWNAANDYSKPYAAMPEMKDANYKERSKDNPKYFRGDEIPTPTVQATLNPAAARP